MDVKLGKGDIATIDYDLWVVGPGDQRTLHETTRLEVAKENDRYDEKKAYGPIPVVVGHERVPKGLDEALLGLAIGASKDIVIPPGKGAGERDSKLVRLMPMREFLRKDIEPEVGLEVTVEGRRGTITAVTAGRVRVDFNNPLAGRTLEYRVTVTGRAEKEEDRVRAVLEMDYGLGEQFRIFPKEDEVDVFLPDVCRTDERWFVSKFRVVADLREFAGFSKVRFVEEYERPKVEAKRPEAPKPEAEEGEATEEAEPQEPPAEEEPAPPKEAPKGPPKAKGKGKPPAKKKAEREPEAPKPKKEREKQPEEL